jgi:hypothetical protein
VGPAHLSQRPRRGGNHALVTTLFKSTISNLVQAYLGAVAGKIAEQSPVEEFKICPLLPNVWPFVASETAYSRPVLCFEIAHAMQQNVKRDTQELMANNNVWIGFVNGD